MYLDSEGLWVGAISVRWPALDASKAVRLAGFTEEERRIERRAGDPPKSTGSSEGLSGDQ